MHSVGACGVSLSLSFSFALSVCVGFHEASSLCHWLFCQVDKERRIDFFHVWGLGERCFFGLVCIGFFFLDFCLVLMGLAVGVGWFGVGGVATSSLTLTSSTSSLGLFMRETEFKAMK